VGDLTELDGEAVYLDANLLIYAVEGYAAFAAALRGLLEAIEAGRIRAVTSELTIAEVLVKPLELGREDLVQVYRDLIEHSGHITLVPVDRAVLVEAARLRAGLGLRLPDAIHVASAVRTGCTAFVSNDRRLALPTTVRRIELG
jgi:predicted nucleic acid-binding protein